MKLPYYIRRFWEIPWLEKKMLLKGYFLAIPIVLMLKSIPLKYYYKLIATQPDFVKDHTIKQNDDNLKYLYIIRRTLGRIEKLTFRRFSCLEKSLLIKCMLNSFGVQGKIAFILNKTPEISLQAHARFFYSGKDIPSLKRNKACVLLIE